MTVWGGIYQIVIGPLRLLLEMVYAAAYAVLGSAGAAIVPLSLAVNFLLLPFYRRADAMQRTQRELEQRMAPGLAHIKTTFRGDERYMMQRAWYRIHGYKPIYALRSAAPLLLQIPFFIAAYSFLSGLELLASTSLGPASNLGVPDGLLQLGGVSVNLLPILMTLSNVLSCEIYTRGMGWKDKLQLYAMAAVFLALLYNSPAGLVLYWTLNNLFSLAKNLIQGAKRPERARTVALSVLGVLCLLYGALAPGLIALLNRAIVILISLLFQIPACRALLRRLRPEKKAAAEAPAAPEKRVFLWSCLFLTLLTGVLIPSAVIRSSPAEFVSITDLHSPVRYLLWSALTAAGGFLLWGRLFYGLAGERGRRAAEAVLWMVSVTAVMNYMLFGTKLGMLTPQMQFEGNFGFTDRQLLVNSEAVLLLGTAALVLWMKGRRAIVFLLPVLAAAALGMSVYNTVQIQGAMPGIRQAVEAGESKEGEIRLSRSGDNVVVVMLDRSISGFIPYLFQEKPELEEAFDGFTWYPNTISLGPATNSGSPGVFGGYEYTPEAMNTRPEELLEDKHNESLLVMPRLFSDLGWAVTVCDPSYAGYSWTPDLSIYDDYPAIHSFLGESGSAFVLPDEASALQEAIWRRDFFCYGLMKASPLVAQIALYQDGLYLDPARAYGDLTQARDGLSRASGISPSFSQSYKMLSALPELTELTDAPGAFFLLCNSTTHNPMLLQEPDYTPALKVDNTQYDAAHADRFVYDGRVLNVETDRQMISYHSNMAALLKLGEWFDCLRDAGVYDRTRIIVVADHGSDLGCFDDMRMEANGPATDLMLYNPLLLVKDFDSHGFSMDTRFMTNADTPSLALADVVDAPVNPFTGKVIDGDAAKQGEQHILYTTAWQIEINRGTTFLPGSWYALSPDGDIFDPAGWRLVAEDATLPSG